MQGQAPQNGSDRARNIVRGIGAMSVQTAVSALLGFAFLGSLLRYLPTNAYGAYAGLQATLGIATIFATFGLQFAVVKFLAPSSGNGGWGHAKAALLLTLGLSALSASVVGGLAPYLSDYFMKSPSWYWVFDLGALWLFTNAVASVLQGLMQALRRYSLLAGALLLSRFAQVGIAVAGLVYYQSLSIAIASWTIYGVILSGVALGVAWKSLPGAKARNSLRPVARYAAPLGVAALFTSVAATADIIVVGGYLNPTSLGIYNASVVIATVLASFFGTPLTTALFAETSFSSEAPAEVSRGLALAIRFGILTVVPASLFAAAVAPQLFGLFSGSSAVYASGIPYLQLITSFYIFATLQTIAINVLQGVGKVKEVLVVGVVTALGEIALAVSLVPSLGLGGAAVSRVTVMTLGCLLSLFFLKGYLKGALRPSFLARTLLASAIPAGVVALLTLVLSSRVLSLLPYALLGVGLFLVCSRATRLLTEEDKGFLAHLLPARLHWVLRLL